MKQLLRGCVYSAMFISQFVASPFEQAQAQDSFIDFDKIAIQMDPQVDTINSESRAPSISQCFAQCEENLRATETTEDRLLVNFGIKFNAGNGEGDTSSGSGTGSEPVINEGRIDAFPEVDPFGNASEEEGVSCGCQSKVFKYKPLATKEDLEREKAKIENSLQDAEQLLARAQCQISSASTVAGNNGLFYGYDSLGDSGGFVAGQNVLALGGLQIGHGMIGQHDDSGARGIVGLTIRFSDRHTFVCGIAIPDLTKPLDGLVGEG